MKNVIFQKGIKVKVASSNPFAVMYKGKEYFVATDPTYSPKHNDMVVDLLNLDGSVFNNQYPVSKLEITDPNVRELPIFNEEKDSDDETA